MSLSFSTPRGSVEQRWIIYALLRDSVQHHLEGGAPTEGFRHLHSIAEALGGKRVVVPARALRDELLRAQAALSGRPLEDLAISARTRAVLSLSWPPPERRETLLVSEWGGSIPLLGDIQGGRLDDVFGHLLRDLLQITEGAGDADQVEICDL